MLTIAMTEDDVEALGFLIQHTSPDGSEEAAIRMIMLTTIKQKLEMLARLWRPGKALLSLSNQEGVELYCYLLRLSEHPIIRTNRVWYGLTLDFLGRIVQEVSKQCPTLQTDAFEVTAIMTGLELDLIRSCLYEWQEDIPYPQSEQVQMLWTVLDSLRDMCLLDAELGKTDAAHNTCSLTFNTQQWTVVASLLYTFMQNSDDTDPDWPFLFRIADHVINTINIARLRAHPLLQEGEQAA